MFDYLNQFPTTTLALKGLNKKDALLYGFYKEYIDLYRDVILEVMIDKVISSNRIKYLYLDTVSIKYNIFSYNYSYIESNWYLAKIYIEMILDEIEDTIRHFNICNIEDIGNLYVKDAIEYYLEYIENYATENEIDKRILRRISELFHITNLPSFSNKEKTKINFFELNLYMNEVNPMNPIAYNATKNIFVMENDFGILDEEDILIDLDFEVNDVLKRFIDKIPIRMIENIKSVLSI